MVETATPNAAATFARERGHQLMAVHRPVHYTDDEQFFSTLLQRRLDELLRGERNTLLLMRKYPHDASRIGIMPTPGELDPRGLRFASVERLIRDTLLFLHADPHSGPASQQVNGDGTFTETRKYTTKFPHIVIQREDIFDAGTEETVQIQWCATRVQNQRKATRINRMLDAANLGLDIVKLFV